MFLLLACTASEGDSAPETPETACNGADALCGRPFDQVVLPATHNSMSNGDAGWLFPNQQHGLTRQLDDGIRGLMLDVYLEDGEPLLCHGDCGLGSQPLDEGLGEIHAFLEAHPREVVAIIFQDAVEPQVIADSFGRVGLRPYTPQGSWPTLEELIDADTRLLAFSESGSEGQPWYLPAWENYWDTPYSWTSVDEMDCSLNRGSTDNELFLINHWIGPLPSPSGAEAANTEEVLRARVEACLQEHGRLPNMLAVDFYDRGALLRVVASLNEGDPDLP